MRTTRIVGIALLVLCGCSHVETDWKKAGTENSIEGYSRFAAKYPRSPHSAVAQERLDWLTATKNDSIQAYAEFLKKYPNSPHHEEVVKLCAPRINVAFEDLVTRISKWTDAERDLNRSILVLDPNNPFGLLLMGVDEARHGRLDKARDAFTRAKSSVKDEEVSDLARDCPVEREGKVYWLVVVRPLWEGPEADAERERLLALAKVTHGGPFIVPEGQCTVIGIKFDTWKDHNSVRTVKYWVDHDLSALSSTK
jgi:hypothetical protein